ncbi:MAG: BON domain-containing protein [Anaerolineae bacterium]
MTGTTSWHRKGTACPICKTTVLPGQDACPECGEDLTLLVLLDSIADGHYNEGLRLATEGDTIAAIEQMLKALAFDPKHVAAGVALGKLYAQSGQYDAAAAAWKQALALDPQNASAQAGLHKLDIVRSGASTRPVSRLWLSAAAVLAVLLLAALALGRGYWLNQPRAADIASRPPTIPIPSPIPTTLPTPAPPDLAAPVAAALRADGELSSLGLDVRQAGRVVYLRGAVQTPDQRRRAESLAKGVAGVEAVDSSDLAIVPRPLAQQVEQALKAAPQLSGATIAAKQVGDVIRLNGSVATPRIKGQAEEIAGKVSGVALVDSRDLVVAVPPLAEAARRALQADPLTTGLNVTVEQAGSALKLAGSVPTLKARLDAETVARQAPGVELVDASGVVVQPTMREITVQAGDTLMGLAQQYYGDPGAWRAIYEANRLGLSSPGLIRVGSRLTLP